MKVLTWFTLFLAIFSFKSYSQSSPQSQITPDQVIQNEGSSDLPSTSTQPQKQEDFPQKLQAYPDSYESDDGDWDPQDEALETVEESDVY